MRFKITLVVLTILMVSSCKKRVIDVYPEIVGNWCSEDWCPFDVSYRVCFNVDSGARGSYGIPGNSSYSWKIEGKVKFEDGDIYVGGDYAFTLMEIKDSVGYIYNPSSTSSMCGYDSLYIKRILRGINRAGLVTTFYEQ